MAIYTVADHLLDRLAERGVDRIFGVPGDFTLGLLDHVDDHPTVGWVGAANELGAGYAADGYARIRGLGVLCTTFGVGELSAINAVAGSRAEHVPVLHLVGSPTTATQAAARPTHHTLGDGDFGHTLRMSAEITVAQAALTADDPCAEIDRVLCAIVEHGLPGYLSLPADVAELPVDPATGPLTPGRRSSDPQALAAFRAAAGDLLRGAPAPVVLADVLVARAGAEDALHALIDRAGLRYASLLWGRRVIDESGPGFVGTYVGAASAPEVRVAVEDAERLIAVGVFFTDLISGFFSTRLDEARRIDVLPHAAVVAGTPFEGLEMSDVLEVLTDLVAGASPPEAGDAAPPATTAPSNPPGDGPLTQLELWDTVGAALAPGDLVLADQGTSFYGLGPHHLPHDALFIGQPLWASIGYTLPALLGAALAAPRRRPVLLIGDGAAQMTVAELGTLLRERVPAIVVVVNNSGYTVERAIHGRTRGYNDIAPWNWAALPAALGGGDRAHGVRVTGAAALGDALARAREDDHRLTLVEAVTGPYDVPPLLEAVAQAAAHANTAATEPRP